MVSIYIKLNQKASKRKDLGLFLEQQIRRISTGYGEETPHTVLRSKLWDA